MPVREIVSAEVVALLVVIAKVVFSADPINACAVFLRLVNQFS